MPEPLGLGEPPHVESARNRWLTVASYTIGGLIAGSIAHGASELKSERVLIASGKLAAGIFRSQVWLRLLGVDRMPVYFFSFHAYRSWMPNRRRGYVRRNEGILPTDAEMASQYEQNAKNNPTTLDQLLQQTLIEELMIACKHQQLRLHGAATEPSHIHTLVSWHHEKGWLAIRMGLKTSLSRRLTIESKPEHHLRLSDGASRKHVRDKAHFDYLMQTYLPKHNGVSWYEDHRDWQNLFPIAGG